MYLYLLFIQKLCASLAHATVYSGLVLKQTQKAAKHSQAVACQAASLPSSLPSSSFPVCLSAPCCMQCICHSVNCFCGLHCKFATLSARVQQLATFKCVSKIYHPPSPPNLTHMFTLEEENFFSNFLLIKRLRVACCLFHK